MEGFIADVFDPLLYILGMLLRPLGGLVLGAVAGWLTASTFQDADKEWQLKIAIFLGLLGAFVCLHIYSGPGTTGFFALGAGATAAVIALRSAQSSKKK
jgi:uncharacterized membrane protein YeaQ/YmgE (transglycosylase-associated protein family)